jgi:hypothetical protein
MAGWCQRVGAVGRWVSLAVIGLGLAVSAAALAQINGPALTLQLQVQPQATTSSTLPSSASGCPRSRDRCGA